jgi:hypothetical protein
MVPVINCVEFTFTIKASLSTHPKTQRSRTKFRSCEKISQMALAIAEVTKAAKTHRSEDVEHDPTCLILPQVSIPSQH